MRVSIKIDPKIHLKDKVYGTTTIGARGQVVIPAEARKELNLNPGDQLMVIGKFGKVLGLIKADQLEDMIALVMDQFEGTGMEKFIKRHIGKVFKPKKAIKHS